MFVRRVAGGSRAQLSPQQHGSGVDGAIERRGQRTPALRYRMRAYIGIEHRCTRTTRYGRGGEKEKIEVACDILSPSSVAGYVPGTSMSAARAAGVTEYNIRERGRACVRALNRTARRAPAFI